jgi:hypothetical protein
MAPTALSPRQGFNSGYCSSYGYYYDYYSHGCYYSGWNAYGRWVLLGAIIVGFFFIFLLFSCVTARRRRRQGLQPYRLTGWAGGVPPSHGQAQYVGNQGGAVPNNQGWGGPGQQAYQSPPAYGGPPPAAGEGTFFPPNHVRPGQGYFGGQQSGIELQQPHNAYNPQRGGEPVYAAPEGPPPGMGMKK